MLERRWYKRVLDEWDAGDLDAFCARLADDATFKWGARPAVRGVAAVKEDAAALRGGFRSARHVITETLEQGATRVCRGDVLYDLPSGREVSVPFCVVFHMEGDWIREYLVYTDSAPLTEHG